MKKKELLKRLEATDAAVEDLRRETLRAKRTTNDIIRLREKILQSEPPAKYACPWCAMSDEPFTCGEASTLRLHEQECGSNRNKWLPQEFQQIMSALDIDTKTLEANYWIGAALDQVEALKVRARRPPEVRRPEGWQDILVELHLDDIKGLVTVDQMIHAIKELKHRGRPVCLVCGASETHPEAMRKHLREQHAITLTPRK